jgi:hypothetical protein
MSFDWKMNLLTAGKHATIDGVPKRWVLYSPTPSPYLIILKNMLSRPCMEAALELDTDYIFQSI